MTHPLPPTGAPDVHDALPDEEYSLPRAEALLAGTLALMTGHAQACCDTHRQTMGRKIVSNLQMLAHTGMFTPHFGTMLRNLQDRWSVLAGDARPDAGAAHDAPGRALSAAEQRRALWVPAPEVVQ